MSEDSLKPTVAGRTAARKLGGQYFHTVKDGEIRLQGKIIDSDEKGMVLVQLFSWFDGRPTDREWWVEQDLEGARFYDSASHWNRAADNENMTRLEK